MTLDGNTLWVLMTGLLVGLMQAGFACLETGMVRAKNSINVAIKNLMDFCITSALFILWGYALMFGDSLGGIIGSPADGLSDAAPPQEVTFFLFQLMFAGTAATIISGAVAERMRFVGYMIITVIMAGIIYPLVGHWIWAKDVANAPAGWLGQAGFIDFAGSTVVHAVAGWTALAAVLVIGPRIGRFGPQGRPIDGNNLPMATLGVFLLWFGFFGFNGGSTYALDERVPGIIVNTALAGAAGGIAAMLMSWLLWRRPKVDRIVNGVIAGLVAICAGCHLASHVEALLVGAIAGLLCVAAMWAMEGLEWDDAIGAVPAHLVSGIWGTLAVALVAPLESLPAGSRLGQFGIQALGCVAAALVAFGLCYLLMRLIDRWLPFRVSAEDERVGLNVAEHGANTALLDLIVQMDQQAKDGDFSGDVQVEPETEAHQISLFYNAVLSRFRSESSRRHEVLERLHRLANYDALTGLANRRMFLDSLHHAVARANRTGRCGALLYLDLDGFKPINDRLGHEAGDELLAQVANRLRHALRDTDLPARLGGDEFCVLLEDIEDVWAVEAVGNKLIDTLTHPFILRHGEARIGASIGAVLFGQGGADEKAEAVLRRADMAMYAAKRAGKGMVKVYDERDDNSNQPLDSADKSPLTS